MCHILRCHDQPVILSACLISMEVHPSLTVLPESLELGEMRGTQVPSSNATTMQNGGQILDDVSVTHILTLPTSASVQVNIRKFFDNEKNTHFFEFIRLACANNASTE